MGVKQNIDSKAGGEVVQAGYCAHGVETFPTWHRTYLGMLEVQNLHPGGLFMGYTD